ncbi:anti-sigma factor [Aquincola tertiaricarbonis]|uniref:Anti-sigma factor n=1 Tax=Aquincola tertiaricarbonis TaxID=391953 RepID=A0ABY4S4H5_AQUTE|nr:anti-sigma factor [Aquincola tertiaricarbonis]URI07125.1 anti-sigma factor [Aquincola tertiaricarbonis]
MIDLRDAVERSAIAGEYVLGTLSPEDHAAVAAALVHDAALRAEVYAWQDRLLPLTRHSPAAEPAAHLWPRIEAALTRPALASAPSAPAAKAPWWQRLGLWQGVSAGALALSAVLMVVVLRLAPLAQTPPDAARYVAVLQSPDNRSTGWVVEVREGGLLRLVPTADAGSVPPGRVWQFWTKLEGAAGPTSLGLVPVGQTVEIPVSRLPGVGAQQLFEITLEPEGGSTIGRPTGPILFVGRSVML